MKTAKSKGKTGRSALLCTHPRREALNEAIAMGQMSMSQVAAQIGANKSSVSRHFRDHLQPAMAAAGGGATLSWNVKRKSRELVERMEGMLDAITRDSATGRSITKRELLRNWQAVRALGGEMREWMRLHGQTTGELSKDNDGTRPMSIQILCPSTTNGTPRISYASAEATDSDIVDLGLIQSP